MNKYFMPMTFLLATLVLLFMYLKEPDPVSSGPKGKVSYDQIHRYQQEANRKIEIRKDRAEFEKNGGAPQIKNGSHFKKGDFDNTSIESGYHQSAEDIADEAYSGEETLDQKMDKFLANRQEFNEYEDMKKEAYVRQFKEEARAMGFDVQIDANMEIVGVRKIKKN